MVKLGFKVDVYNRRGNNVQDKKVSAGKKKLKKYKGINIITVPTINKKGIDAFIYSVLATIIALFKHYDVIHYHAEGPCAMLWLPHFFGIKTVATIHGLDWKRAKWGGFATRYIKFGEKMAAKYADEVIVLSKDVERYFKEQYNRYTNFIPNGVNNPKIRELKIIKEKYGLNKNDYILFLARIVPEKGLHYLIDAYKKINTEKKLVIAGGASHTNDYLNKIRKMIEKNKNIIMTGFVQGEELEELYSNCFAYCLPSDIEGMPLSLLEAMSYGCKCIVSDIDENVNVIKDYGLTFKKGNIESLTTVLQKTIDGNFKMKDGISEYVLNTYTWEKNVDKTVDLYKKIKKA